MDSGVSRLKTNTSDSRQLFLGWRSSDGSSDADHTHSFWAGHAPPSRTQEAHEYSIESKDGGGGGKDILTNADAKCILEKGVKCVGRSSFYSSNLKNFFGAFDFKYPKPDNHQ